MTDKHIDPTGASETTGERPVKPANIIIDLLRTYADRGTSVANIMASGAMFGFSNNQMRVGLSRLVTKQTIENFSRGFYRLSKTADPFNTFIERWRLGESRIVPWDHRWLLVHRSRDTAPTKNAKSEWALANHGFREAIKDCWIRPDNIALGLDELEQQLHHLGLEHEAMLAGAAKLKPRWHHRWLNQVAPEQLIKGYHAMSRRLTLSLAELPNLTRAAALKSSFQLGGQGIEMLATDPLLPTEMLDTEPRMSLTQRMRDYDRIGREIWLGD
jgi:phenylacetic acid degradation operon negative regulatory protein